MITVEGNIGSGKSTFVSLLEKTLGGHFGKAARPLRFVQEPVAEWEEIRNENGESMVSLFYKEPAKRAFSFQMMAYVSRLSNLMREAEGNPACTLVSERSIQTDKNVFAKLNYDLKNIDECDYQIYNRWFSDFGRLSPKVDGIIYIKADPATCLERARGRSRQGEDQVTLDYLALCNTAHEDWLKNVEVPILTIEAAKLKVGTIPEDILGEVTAFIEMATA